MATKTQIRNKALRELGVLRLSQDPQDQDKVELEAAYDEVYAELKEEGLATWAATGEVPSKIVPYVVAWVAITRSGTYGISNDRYVRLLARAGVSGEVAKREIRRLLTPAYESLDEPTDF